MNERIRELALKAAEGSSWKPGLGNEHVQEYFQAFAELIVRECIECLNMQTRQNDDVRTTVGTAEKTLKQHFNIESP